MGNSGYSQLAVAHCLLPVGFFSRQQSHPRPVWRRRFHLFTSLPPLQHTYANWQNEVTNLTGDVVGKNSVLTMKKSRAAPPTS
jgi:hypothetical protein